MCITIGLSAAWHYKSTTAVLLDMSHNWKTDWLPVWSLLLGHHRFQPGVQRSISRGHDLKCIWNIIHFHQNMINTWWLKIFPCFKVLVMLTISVPHWTDLQWRMDRYNDVKVQSPHKSIWAVSNYPTTKTIQYWKLFEPITRHYQCIRQILYSLITKAHLWTLFSCGSEDFVADLTWLYVQSTSFQHIYELDLKYC